MLMKSQALGMYHQLLKRPTGCPQRIWERASDSTRRILIEAARSK